MRSLLQHFIGLFCSIVLLYSCNGTRTNVNHADSIHIPHSNAELKIDSTTMVVRFNTELDTTILQSGKPFFGKVDSIPKNRQVLVNTNSISEVTYTTINGISYYFCESPIEPYRVYRVFCNDPKFTQDHVRIGDSYGSVKRVLKDTTPHTEMAYSIYIDLPSGWRAVFRYPEELGNRTTISDTDRLQWFYR